MSTIAIEVTEPGGSPADITDDCVFEACWFSGLMGGVPGRFNVKVRDPDQTYDFVTGSEITLTVDGVLLFGGFITIVNMGHFAPAAPIPDPVSDYQLRTWTLTGPDYNILFDKRVWRDTGDYLGFIDLSAFVTDGAILREAIDNYADMSGYDSSGIVDIADIPTGDVLQQGDPLRKEFENLSLFGGAVWYIRPDKKVIYVPYDDVVKRWGFSDVPNRIPITVSPDEYQGATYPFREVTGQEDATYMANDALIWGGTAPASDGIVFSRTQDAGSIAAHGRWQIGETHFGERLFAIQDQVDARSDVIVNGPPGADVTGQQKGLKNPQQQFTFKWFSADVPLLSGTPDHIRPGDIVTIVLDVFDTTVLLPVRELRISFPDAFENDGTHLVQFDGTFGLQLSDPYSLWRFLRVAQVQAQSAVVAPSVVTEGSPTAGFGSYFYGTPTPVTDGSTTTFAIAFPYMPGSLVVFLNGLQQRPGVDFTESDPTTGEFEMTDPPESTDALYVTCLTAEA